MKNIGFIGLGLMGKPMANHFLNKKYKLFIWNRTSSKVLSLIKKGASYQNDLNYLLLQSDIIITMLTDDSAVNEIVNNDNFFKNIKNKILIDMSSISPGMAIKLYNLSKKNGVSFLDAPVSGGTKGAKEGSLAIMVGGEKKSFFKVRKILEEMGTPTYLGKAGNGQIAKLANQTIVAITIGAVAEAILLSNTAGIKPEVLLKALKGGFADSKILQLHGRRMISDNFKPGGLSSTQLKDLNNIINHSKKMSLKLPLSLNTQKLFKSLVKNGYGNLDHSALFLEIKNKNLK